MSCARKLVADIVNKCQSVRGLKPLAYWAYRNDVALTISDNVVTGVWTDKLGIFEATKFGLNAGHEVVEFEDNGEHYKHKFNAIFNIKDINIDLLDDIVVFVQTNEGTWLCYGATQGLWKATQASMSNDNNATIAVELTSRDGQGEQYAEYDVTFDLSTIPSIDDWDDSVLTAVQIAYIIRASVNRGVYNGSLDVSGGTNAGIEEFEALASPDDDVTANLTTLDDRGWTVAYNA